LTAEQSHASPAEQDSQTLKALEIANIRLSAANEKNTLLEQRIADKDITIKALEDAIATRKELGAELKSANQDRATVNNGDARMLVACNAQVDKAEARIFKLEHPGLLRQIFDTRSATGFMFGYGAAKAQSALTK
jgi:hypothetical protein